MRNRTLPLVASLGLAATLVVAQDVPTTTTPQPVAFVAPAPKEAAAAADALKVSPSKVAAVTVYPNSALVTREVEVVGGAGRMELVISPLPGSTVPSSLYAEGAEGIRVLMTRFRTRPIFQDTRADVRKLQDEIKQIQLGKEKTEGDLQAVTDNAKQLTKMEGFLGVTTIQATEKGALNAEAAIALAKYVRETRLESAKQIVALRQEVQGSQDKIDLVTKQLTALTSGVSRYEQDAIVVVEKANAAAGTIRLSYLADGASWHPQYKLRADKDGKDNVVLEYLAAIVQNTGEDWSNVRLMLSTAQPMLNAAPPELQTLHVAAAPKGTVAPQLAVAEVEEQIKVLRSKAQKDFNEKKQTSGIGLVNTAAAQEQSWELFNPELAVKRGCMLAYREGPTVSYGIAARLTVPSRPDEQVLEVNKGDLKAEFYFKAVPILSTHVYRMAAMVNKGEHVLLPGEATMYVGADFVGQMGLPLVAVGEQFTAGFGVDPQIQVQRQMTDKMRSTQGGNQLLRYDYRILINNYKTEPAKLQVWDRLPSAENDSINVSLLKTTPELSTDSLYLREQKPNNLLRWDVTVAANAKADKALSIDFEFKLELDRQMTIGGAHTAGIYGAGGARSASSLPPISGADRAKMRLAMDKLAPEDRRMAEAQVYCAIDRDSPLGTMGPIYKVMVKGQPVFLCCKGCEAEAKAHPDDTLVQFQRLMGRMSGEK